MKLKARTASIIINPGKTQSHGQSLKYSLPSFSMLPHSGVGGWAPSPRYPRAAMLSMTEPRLES